MEEAGLSQPQIKGMHSASPCYMVLCSGIHCFQGSEKAVATQGCKCSEQLVCKGLQHRLAACSTEMQAVQLSKLRPAGLTPYAPSQRQNPNQ